MSSSRSTLIVSSGVLMPPILLFTAQFERTSSYSEAQQRLAQFVSNWEKIEPKAVHAFKWGIHTTFSFYDFDKELHGHIRTTNHLERFFREFRNKADEIGAFPNETSCLTLFSLVMLRDHAKHDRWVVANNS